MLLLTVVVFASCGSPALETWGGSRFEAKYDRDVFAPTSSYENDLTLRLIDADIDVISISAIAPYSADKKATRDDYFESAKNEFESEFDKILNSKSDKYDNKGVTTYIQAITATKPGSEDNYSAVLKFTIMDNALMMVKMSVKSELFVKHSAKINEVLESAILKGAIQ